MRKPRPLACLASLWLLLSAGLAHAELTVLPILRDGRSSEALTQSVAERLQLLGEEPEAARAGLTMAELSCALPSCLSGLATRLQAKRLLQGSVVSTAPRRYSLQLLLFERGSGRLQKQSNACDDCSDRQLQDLLASSAARLVDAAGHGAGIERAGTPPTTRTVEPGGSAGSAAIERRLLELTEQIKSDRALQQKVREQLEALAHSSEAQGRALETLRGSLDKARDGQDRLREQVDKSRGVTDKTRSEAERARESSDRTHEVAERLRQATQDARQDQRDSAKKTQASVDGLRQSIERTGETANKVQASVDGLRQSVERTGESAQKVQVSVEGLRQAVDRVREASDGSRAAADATRAAAERLGPAFERVTQGLDAAQKTAATAAMASQASNQLASKTLAGIEQMNALSGDLRTALTQVEPLRQAAEQTQTTAQANAKQSSELLLLAQKERGASTETLQQASHALTLVQTVEARRALPRGRKIGAAILGSVSVVMTGVAVTLSALNGYVPDKEASCSIGGVLTQGCPLDFSAAYIPVSAIAASFAAAGSIAFLSAPVRP